MTAHREKAMIRSQLLAKRATLNSAERQAAADALRARLLSLPESQNATTVAAYVSVRPEPDTRLLLEELRNRGIRVLLPVLRPDHDLDWADYDGPASLALGQTYGSTKLPEPTGPRLGVATVTQAEVVLVPALAVDRQGHRLGRGGGSYDRALARLPADRCIVALLYDHELLDTVPVEPHDCNVTLAATPSDLHRLD